MAEKERKERPVAKSSGYPVDALKRSERFANRKDHLTILLDPEKEYSIKQVEDKISEFMKGKVK